VSSYDRKKYVWKLIYAFILGYNIEFGHSEAVSLINQTKFTEKTTGYIAIGIMLNEKTDFGLFYNCMETIKQDLVSGNEVYEALAISTLGNIGSSQLAKEMSPAIIHKAMSDNRGITTQVRKKACICLLSFMRKNKDIYDEKVWIEGFKYLLTSMNLGLLLSATSLMLGTIKMKGPSGYEPFVGPLIHILKTMNEHAQEYFYYMTACPWLQIKIF
jgi:AP-2 complex subunit alpha